MKKQKYLHYLFFYTLSLLLLSCGSDDPGTYIQVSPVVLDLTAVPYAKLSEYKFFEGDIKDQNPAFKVVPYEPNSMLFTDYAHKKRFVWMPEGTSATYDADGKILNFPTGAVFIKSFYYDNVQPANTTRIIETRLMIKKETEWVFANYIWNSEQTEALLDMNGSYTEVSWNQGGTVKSTNYRIPSETECYTCHKSEDKPVPIGPKPQNLNKNLAYSDGTQNQLERWIQEGYLEIKPNTITSTVNWEDTAQPLELRVRSYLDINCAHCHSEGAHCDYRPLKLAFSETANPVNMGICVTPDENINNSLTYIVTKQNANRSVMHYRLSATDQSVRMPLLGRSIVHEEAAAMIKEWINTMETPCE